MKYDEAIDNIEDRIHQHMFQLFNNDLLIIPINYNQDE